MPVYKYETHLHTSQASACGVSSGAEMADAYKEAGYTGIIVTDHFFNGNTSIPYYKLSWKESVGLFCSGYEDAKKRGDEIGLQVFFGWEFNCETAEFLTYGLDKEWLLENGIIMSMGYPEYLEYIKKEGGFTVHAHPFRQRSYINKIELIPDYTGAVEIFNSGNSNTLFDERAKWYAESYGLAVTAGSDAHFAFDTQRSGVEVPYRLETVHDYISAVKNRDVVIINN